MVSFQLNYSNNDAFCLCLLIIGDDDFTLSQLNTVTNITITCVASIAGIAGITSITSAKGHLSLCKCGSFVRSIGLCTGASILLCDLVVDEEVLSRVPIELRGWEKMPLNQEQHLSTENNTQQPTHDLIEPL